MNSNKVYFIFLRVIPGMDRVKKDLNPKNKSVNELSVHVNLYFGIIHHQISRNEDFYYSRYGGIGLKKGQDSKNRDKK